MNQSKGRSIAGNFLSACLCLTCVVGLGCTTRIAAANPLAKTIQVGGVTFDPASPPKPLVLRRRIGLVTAPAVDGQLVHESKRNLFETRATITPGGDYLLMFPEGQHYGGHKGKVNNMIAYRSSDKGKTWTGPKAAFDIDYAQHGFIPLIPRGTKRIYAFGTQPIEGKREGNENCPIGFRWSDDDGRTWSKVTLIRPTNNPDFLGMSVMRMCETDAGTWLLGSHEGRWKRTPKGPVGTRAYVLRSEDKGKTWTVHPKPRPGGWYLEKFDRMDEPRPINLGGGKAMILARSCEGHLFEIRSDDDGRTWSKPKPTALVHPDAPPMLFHHPDGKTLIAFHHNRHSGGHFKQTDRSEIWVSLSADQGRTWSEPRFVFANALAPGRQSDWYNHQCSYLDAFADGEDLHLFIPHRWKRALHLRLKASDLKKLPTKAQISAVPAVTKAPGKDRKITGAGNSAEGKLDSFLGEPKLDVQQVFKGQRLPNVIVATDGTVLAVWGWGSVRVRRSEDGGKSWGAEIELGKGLNSGGAIVNETNGEILVFTESKHPPAPLTVYRSKDHGKTWSEMKVQIKPDKNGNVPSMCMNEHGITLRHGKYAGRIIRPARDYAGKNERARWPRHYTTAVYSDDGGKTWHTSDPFPAMGTGEATLAELSDGRIYYNSRRHWAPKGENSRRRWTAWSEDGGKTWKDLSICKVLPDGDQIRDYGLMAGLVRLPIRGRDILIFSNIESPSGRHHGTIWASFDGGKTWPIKRLVREGSFAYSSLNAGRPATKSEGWIYLHFESDGSKVARFNLSWVLKGEKTGDGKLPKWLVR